MKIKRKPEWLKVKLPSTDEFKQVKAILTKHHLHSVCQEARCPNITECFDSGTATFLILGDVCTRSCLYCNVASGHPETLDQEEPDRLAIAVKQLGLSYIVITSVTRDDLEDGGAEIFARSVELLKAQDDACRVEVLIPDFGGNWEALQRVIAARPDVINHNTEVAGSLFGQLRPQGDLEISLQLLERVRESGIASKSGFMIGVGESWQDIVDLMQRLRAAGCQRLTIGQYLQPTREHWPLAKYYTPEEFSELRDIAYDLGFDFVESGPLVRSSYHAALASK